MWHFNCVVPLSEWPIPGYVVAHAEADSSTGYCRVDAHSGSLILNPMYSWAYAYVGPSVTIDSSASSTLATSTVTIRSVTVDQSKVSEALRSTIRKHVLEIIKQALLEDMKSLQKKYSEVKDPFLREKILELIKKINTQIQRVELELASLGSSKSTKENFNGNIVVPKSLKVLKILSPTSVTINAIIVPRGEINVYAAAGAPSPTGGTISGYAKANATLMLQVLVYKIYGDTGELVTYGTEKYTLKAEVLAIDKPKIYAKQQTFTGSPCLVSVNTVLEPGEYIILAGGYVWTDSLAVGAADSTANAAFYGSDIYIYVPQIEVTIG